MKYRVYADYFNRNFNLTFGCPQADACSECERLNTLLSDRTLTRKAEVERNQDSSCEKNEQILVSFPK